MNIGHKIAKVKLYNPYDLSSTTDEELLVDRVVHIRGLNVRSLRKWVLGLWIKGTIDNRVITRKISEARALRGLGGF